MVQTACRCEDLRVLARHLQAALAALDDLERARGELVSAWRIAPQERLARLVELVDERRGHADHVAARAIGDGPGTRASAALAKLPPDPRIAPVLLDLLAQPPWRSNPTLPFWRACCDTLVASRDPRVLARLEEVAAGYPRTIPTTVGMKVAGYLHKGIARLQHAIATVAPLEPVALELCAQLEARLGFAAAKVTAGTFITDELLAAVLAAPDDDGPRLVLADHLAQRGDPRGELINLQLAREAGRSDPSTRARELELVAEGKERWLGRIAVAVVGAHVVFRRGFLAYAHIPRTRSVLPMVVGEAAWNTIELLSVQWSAVIGSSRPALRTIIDGARGLRGVLGVPAAFLATLADRARLERIEDVAIDTRAERDIVIDWLATARAPRRLGIAAAKANRAQLEMAAPELAHVEPIVRAPGFARLDTFVILGPGQLARWLALVEPTPLRRLVFVLHSGLAVELTRDGERFARAVFRYATDDPSGRFPNDAAAWAMRSLERPLDVVIDARTPFFPGMTRHHLRPLHGGATLGGIVDDLDAL